MNFREFESFDQNTQLTAGRLVSRLFESNLKVDSGELSDNKKHLENYFQIVAFLEEARICFSDYENSFVGFSKEDLTSEVIEMLAEAIFVCLAALHESLSQLTG